MKGKKNKGQTTLEYTVLFIIVVGVLIAMQQYMKRGIQGRWKESIDGMGEQYDPTAMTSDTRHRMSSSTNTQIITIPAPGGYYSQRTDQSDSSETKTGSSTLGAY